MKTIRRAIIVNYSTGFGEVTNIEELNKLLADDWTISHTCPMPSGKCDFSVCLVVLEKEISDKGLQRRKE